MKRRHQPWPSDETCARFEAVVLRTGDFLAVDFLAGDFFAGDFFADPVVADRFADTLRARVFLAGADGSPVGSSGGAAAGGAGTLLRPKPGIRRPNMPPADSASETSGARRPLRSIIARMNSPTSIGNATIR